jgi:hypothetical protein
MTLLCVSAVAHAAPEPGAAREIPLFAVSKSENRNFVAYALRVDERCRPIGGAPVRAYWRMLEKGGGTEPLLAREERAYGIARQAIASDVVRLSLRAMPGREITVISWRVGDTCAAAAWTTVANVPARLLEVHAVLQWPIGVDHLVVRGVSRSGRAVEELVDP